MSIVSIIVAMCFDWWWLVLNGFKYQSQDDKSQPLHNYGVKAYCSTSAGGYQSKWQKDLMQHNAPGALFRTCSQYPVHKLQNSNALLFYYCNRGTLWDSASDWKINWRETCPSECQKKWFRTDRPFSIIVFFRTDHFPSPKSIVENPSLTSPPLSILCAPRVT